MANTRSLIVTIVGDSSSYERALKRSSVASTQFQQDAGKVQQVGARLSTLKGIGAGLIASEAFQAGREFVDIASNLNEQVSKGRQIFGDSAGEIERWSRVTASSIGVARDQALEATGTFGNLLVPMGVAPAAAAEVARSFVQLGADLASFNNADPTQTLEALRALLIGEYEPARRFGITLSEAAVQQRALADTGKSSVKELTNQEKVLARVALAMQQTTLAQGDFARTSEGLANSQRKLAAEARDLEAALGKLLIPAAETLTSNLLSATEGAIALASAIGALASLELPSGSDLKDIGQSLANILYLNNPAAYFGSRAYDFLFGGSGTPGVGGAASSRIVDPKTGALIIGAAPDFSKKLPRSIFDTARAPLVNVPQGFQNAILRAQNDNDRDALKNILIRTRQFEEQQLLRAIDADDTKAVGQIRSNIENLQGQIQRIYQEIAAETKRTADAAAARAAEAKRKAADAARERGEAIVRSFDDLGSAVAEGVNAAAAAVQGIATRAKENADRVRDAMLAEIDRQQDNANVNRRLRDTTDALRQANVAGGKIGIRNALEDFADAQRARDRFRIEQSTFTGTASGAVVINGAINITVPGAGQPEKVARDVVAMLQRQGKQLAPEFSGVNPGGIYGIPH